MSLLLTQVIDVTLVVGVLACKVTLVLHLLSAHLRVVSLDGTRTGEAPDWWKRRGVPDEGRTSSAFSLALGP